MCRRCEDTGFNTNTRVLCHCDALAPISDQEMREYELELLAEVDWDSGSVYDDLVDDEHEADDEYDAVDTYDPELDWWWESW